MNRKLSILYAYIVRLITYFLPDIPFFMRLRGGLYSLAMPQCGKNFQVAHSSILNSISELKIQDNVYLANNTSLLCGGGIKIESNVIIGPGSVISSNNHTFMSDSGFRFGAVNKGEVTIGSGSWICANSVITKGASFPPNSILAPCSVYGAKKNEESGIFSGSPACYVRDIKHGD
ncbi:acyltransferase [Vibrio sp. 10N.261.55.F6]|uniref:acyltransferase n=1 Tax=Vibrio sp. 10N.261.55.F6 TaxID=3229693 RepID=UPI00354BFB26